MYAPTWRDDEAIREGSYQFNVNFDIEALRQALDDDYVILLRMHYLVVTRIDEHDDFVKDVSDYEDISFILNQRCVSYRLLICHVRLRCIKVSANFLCI